MPGFASPRQLASMRATVRKMCPDIGVNSRTGARFPLELEPDSREHHLPGAASIARMRRWVLTAPEGTDAQRYDVVFVPTLADASATLQTGPGYWVAEVTQPVSYQTETTLLAWQIYEADGTQVDPISENCTCHLLRQGVQVGGDRRARFMPGTPAMVSGSSGSMGERLPDQLFVSFAQTDWRLGDVVEIIALDYFGALPHPHRWRCQNPRYTSEPPSFISIDLVGEAGAFGS